MFNHILLSLRSKNLEEASFEEKVELIARLGVKVIPAEDLKTRPNQLSIEPG